MTEYKKLTDEELIRRLRMGETGIIDYLMEKYKNLVRKEANAMYLLGGETDDLIQEGMIGLFQAVRDYQPDKNTLFSTFANLCVVRQLCKAIEVSGRKKHKPLNAYVSLSGDDSPLLEAFDFSQQNPETIVIDRENTEQMRNKIRECLSEFENEVLDLYLEGKTYTQIAVLMEKTPKSIDNALQRIRGKIKELSLDSR